MGRDYKHRGRRKKKGRPASSWQSLLAGFGLGLIVALSVYVYDRRPGGIASDRPQPMPVAAQRADSAEETPAHDGERFDFYEELPRFKVIIPEHEKDVTPNSTPETLTSPGSYELQAGSFRQLADADRMQATLALQGMESRIQKVSIDNDQTWHRVRIGPIGDLAELNRMRRQLQEASIDVLVIRVGE